MKHLLILYGVCLLMVFLTACPGDDGGTPTPIDDKTPAEIECGKLNGKTWQIGTVIKSGTDVTAELTGFTIKFDCTLTTDKTNVNGNFTTTNGEGVFPASGTWTFDASTLSGSNKVMVLVVDGENRRTTYTLNNDDTKLILNFEIGGDKKSGDFTFDLEKQ